MTLRLRLPFATAVALAAGALAATPAHAVDMSVQVLAAQALPATVPATQDLVNGAFTILANPSAGAGHVTGDGVDETTTWAFDFSSHPNYAAFMATGGVAEARLTLQLNTAFFVNGEAPWTDIVRPALMSGAGVFPGWVIAPFLSGAPGTYVAGQTTASLVAQVGMSGADLFNWLSTNNGLFPMLYGDDAIVTGATLHLVSTPVPEPAPLALLAAGGLLLAWRRRAARS